MVNSAGSFFLVVLPLVRHFYPVFKQCAFLSLHLLNIYNREV